MVSRIGPFILMSEPAQFGETLVFNEVTGYALTTMPWQCGHVNAQVSKVFGKTSVQVKVDAEDTIVIRDGNGDVVIAPDIGINDYRCIGRIPELDVMHYVVSLPNIVMHTVLLMRITNYVRCICIPMFADVTKVAADPFASQLASKIAGRARETVTISDIISMLGLTHVVDAQIATNIITQHATEHDALSIAECINEVCHKLKLQRADTIHIASSLHGLTLHLETDHDDVRRAITDVVEIPALFITTASINGNRPFVFAFIAQVVIIIHDGETALGPSKPAPDGSIIITNPAQKLEANRMVIAGEIEVARRYMHHLFNVSPVATIVLETGTGNITTYKMPQH